MISASDEEKLPGNDTKVGQKVFLERRPELNQEDSIDSGQGHFVTLENVENDQISEQQSPESEECHQHQTFSFCTISKSSCNRRWYWWHELGFFPILRFGRLSPKRARKTPARR